MVEETAQKEYYIERFSIISEFAKRVSQSLKDKTTYNLYNDKYSELISKRSGGDEWEIFLIKFFY